MANIDTALAAIKDAVEQLIGLGQKTAPAWTTPRAPGKWSPSQIVEHVARALEESANVATRTFRTGKSRVRANFDVYNMFNAGNVLRITDRYAPTNNQWLNAVQIMGGRLMKFGAQLDF